MERAVRELDRSRCRAPTVREIATATGLDDEQVLEAMRAQRGRTSLSMQTARTGDADGSPLEDALGSEEEGFAHAEHRTTLDQLFVLLPARDREVLRLRFREEMTQSEIGARIGVGQMQVSRILRRAINRLRDVAAEQPRLAAGARDG